MIFTRTKTKKERGQEIAPLSFSSFLPQVLTFFKGKQRVRPETTEWSKDSWVYNFFRLYEKIFWREQGIRVEMSSYVEKQDGGTVISGHAFHTLESFLVFAEGMIRQRIPRLKIVKVHVPVFAFAGAEFHKFESPYLFAIAFDTADGNTNNSGGLTVSYSHTASGSGPLLLVGVADESGDNTTSVVWNVTALTQLNKANRTTPRVYLYYGLGLTGTQTILATRTSTSGVYFSSASSYSGVKQSGFPDASNTNNNQGSSIATSVTVVASNSWAALYTYGDNGGCAAGTNSTQRNIRNTTCGIFDSNGAQSPGSFTMTITYTGSSNNAVCMCSFTIPVPTAVSMTANVTGTALLTKANNFVKSLASSVTGAASVSKITTFKRTLTATATSTTNLFRGFFKTIIATVTGTGKVNIVRPIQIFINGVDQSALIDWASIKKVEVLTSQPDSLLFLIRNVPSKTYRPALNDDVKMYRNGNLIFGGVVLSTTETIQGLVKYFNVTCKDYTELLDTVLISKSYTSMTAAAIIADLISTYAPGFSVSNVVAPFAVDAINFNYISLSQCLQKLAEAIPVYDWYVDYSKDIHFFQASVNPAPFILDDTSGNFNYDSLEFDSDMSQLRNSVVVRGGDYQGATVTSNKVSDGAQIIYFVGYNLINFTAQHALAASPTSFASLTVGKDGADDPASFNCLYNPNLGLLRFPTAYPAGDVVQSSGIPVFPISAIANNLTSQALYGVKGYLIVDKNISSKQQAIDRANADILKNSLPNYTGRFVTYKDGLVQGQAITINCPLRSILGIFKIQQIETSLKTPSAHTADLKYTVDFCTTLDVGMVDILNKLLIKDVADLIDISMNEVPNRIYGFNETISITESVIASTSHHPQLETITIVETANYARKNYGTVNVLGPYIPTIYPNLSNVQAWYSPSWAKRVMVTIDHTKVSNTDQTNFPVYVDLSGLGSDFWANVQNGGGDIRVTSSDGLTELAREVVFCDTGTNTGELHLLIPTLSHTTDTQVYIYYGNSSASDYAVSATYGARNVWGNNAKYIGHFQTNANDSSASANDGVVTGATLVSGRFGKAYQFNGSSGQFITIPAYTLGSSWSYSLWVKCTQAIATQRPFNKRTGNTGTLVQTPVSGAAISYDVLIGNGTALNTNHLDSGFPDLNVEVKITVVYNGTNALIYKNGVLATTSSSFTYSDANVSTILGTGSSPNFFQGTIEEVRVLNSTILSADWQATEYSNETAAASFYSVASAETHDGKRQFVLDGSLLA